MKYKLVTISPIRTKIVDQNNNEVAWVFSGGRNNWNIFGLLPGELLTWAPKKNRIISPYSTYIETKTAEKV